MNSQPRRLIEHAALWIRWRWFLIGVVFAAALLTAIISSMLPKTYRATAVVLPPFEGGATIPFLGGVSVDVFGVNEVPASGLTTLLKSRALKDRVNLRLNLMKHYEKENLERAYLAFEDHLEVELESEESFGAVSIIAFKIHVLDRDPKFAAELLNVVVEEWDRLCVELNQRGARLRREFVEQNLRQATTELAVVEDSLRAFEEKHGLASIEAQVQGTVTSFVALEQKIAEVRVAVQVMEKLFQPSHPELQRAKLELQGLLQEQNKMQTSESEAGLLLPLNLAPEISLNFARLFRQVKTLEAINEVLIQQYEQSRMQEVKDMPALRIVDRGQVPQHKYKPKRIILVAVASLTAFFLAVLLMYFKNYLKQSKNSDEHRWVEEIFSNLSTDLQWLKRFLPRGGR